ncbi:MAG: polysaccharide pyruvyl transferase CsaB [Candidatus Aquicultor sp.]
MKKVLISGYYGFGNTGDEAILSAMITSLRSEIPNIEITVSSFHPYETEARYGVKAIPRSIKAIRRTLKKSDLFVSGGGGLLQDVTSVHSLVYYCLLLIVARVERVPVMIYGQGIGPIKRFFSKFLVKLAISGCNIIAVRDEGSKRFLEKIGVRREIAVTADPALLLKPVRVSRLAGIKRPAIGFALRAWPGIDFTRIAKAADEVADRFDASVVLIPFHGGRDKSVAEQVAGRMVQKAMVIDNVELPSETLGVIGELDVLVGMRLHSTIFAAVQGVPFIPVAYDPKVEEFSSSVGALQAIACKDITSDTLIPGIEKLLSHTGGFAYAVEDLRIRARHNAVLAKHLLKERRILGIRFDALEMDEAAVIIEGYIAEKKPHLVVTLNAEMMVMARDDEGFRSVLKKADLLVPDSIGIVWAGRLRARVPGIDMVDELARRAALRGHKVFMIGSKKDVVEEAAAELQRRYPGLNIVGARCGYFSKGEEKQVVDEIRHASPDVLFVGLGMGKQEKWIAKHLYYLNVPVCLGVGGSFDVIAGKVKRAPVWIRQAGLEWLYRLLQQPTRLKRVLALPKFVFMVIRERRLY